MKALFDFLPLLLFFAAYKLYDIYVGTIVAIAATLIQVGVYLYKYRRVEAIPLVTLAVILVFGGLTIALQDDTFIKWKPTIVYWIFAGLMLGSHWLGKKTAVEFALRSQLQLPEKVWRRLNLSWSVFFTVLGALNLYVAFFYRLELDDAARTDIWVNVKVFGLLGLTLVFVIVQALFLAKYLEPDSQEEKT